MKPIRVTNKANGSGTIVAFVGGEEAPASAIVVWLDGRISNVPLSSLEAVKASDFAKWHGLSE